MSLAGLSLIPGVLSQSDSFTFGPIYQALTQVVLPYVPLLDINLPHGEMALIIFGLLIVAAKGLVRFNKFSDDKFAEYVLVGTLLSVLTSLAVAKWVSVIMVR